MLISFHYYKYLWLAHPVISLDWLHFLRPERHWVPLSYCLKQLWNNCWYCKARCIGFNHYSPSWVVMDQNWCGNKEPLEFLKCFLCLFCENKFFPFEFITFEYVWEACGHLTECINESAVEICKPEKLLNISEWSWEWSFYYGFNTTKIYWDTLLTHYKSYKLNF